jgi:hypothetical protein
MWKMLLSYFGMKAARKGMLGSTAAKATNKLATRTPPLGGGLWGLVLFAFMNRKQLTQLVSRRRGFGIGNFRFAR